jgi:hypothetical protein
LDGQEQKKLLSLNENLDSFRTLTVLKKLSILKALRIKQIKSRTYSDQMETETLLILGPRKK